MGLLVFVLVLLSSTDVFACSQCVDSYYAYLLPPVQLWYIVPVLWYLSQSIANGVRTKRTKGIISPGWAIVICVLLFFAAGAGFGAAAFFPLIYSSIAGLVRAIFQYKKTGVRNTPVFVTGIVFFAVYISWISWFLFADRNKIEIEYLSKWGCNERASELLQRRASEPAEDLTFYREALKNGAKCSNNTIIERLVAVGDPNENVVVLENFRKRITQRQTLFTDVELLDKAISDLHERSVTPND